MDSLRETKTDGSGFQLIATRDEFSDCYPYEMDDDFGAGYQVCTECLDEKALTEFHKGKVVCKKCRSIKKDFVMPKKVRNDRIQQALEAAAYRYIKEIM